MKLRTRITVTFVLIFFIAFGVTNVINTVSTYNQAKKKTISESVGFVTRYSDQLSAFFEKNITVISTIANTPQAKRADWNELREYFISERNRNNQFEKFLLGDTQSYFYVSSKKGNPHYGGLQTDNNFKKGSRLKSISHRDYWHKTVRDNKNAQPVTYVSDPVIAMTSGAKQIMIASTIINDDGILKGMMSGSITWETIDDKIKHINKNLLDVIGTRAKFMVLTHSGTYFYHFEKNKNIHLAVSGGKKRTVTSKITDEKEEYLLKLGDKMVAGKTGFIKEEGHYIFYAPIKSANFSMAIFVPEDYIFAQVKPLIISNIITTVVSLIILAIISIFISNSIIKPISVLTRRFQEFAIGSGDLTKRIPVTTKDEIAMLSKSFNDFLDNTHNLIFKIMRGSKSLTNVVGEISEENENLSQRTTEQSSALEEIAATIEESLSSITQNADNALRADKLSEESYKEAINGGNVLKETVASISDINDTGKKIGEITSVINEIAFQTNLLALNASVEAARAGDTGKGFAVVANEVKNLAQRSSAAAREIETLIGVSLNKMEKGMEMANHSNDALNEIINGVTMLKKVISEISSASFEQKNAIEQINTAISELDSMNQMNASMVEELASVSKDMTGQSGELLGLVETFKVDDHLK